MYTLKDIANFHPSSNIYDILFIEAKLMQLNTDQSELHPNVSHNYKIEITCLASLR